MNYLEDESTVYRKKQPSDVSKSEKKSDHKHYYVDVLLKMLYNDRVHFHKAMVCKKCGKIRDVRYFETRKATVGGGRIVKEQGEILEEYKGLPVLACTGFSPDYVDNFEEIVNLL